MNRSKKHESLHSEAVKCWWWGHICLLRVNNWEIWGKATGRMAWMNECYAENGKHWKWKDERSLGFMSHISEMNFMQSWWHDLWCQTSGNQWMFIWEDGIPRMNPVKLEIFNFYMSINMDEMDNLQIHGVMWWYKELLSNTCILDGNILHSSQTLGLRITVPKYQEHQVHCFSLYQAM